MRALALVLVLVAAPAVGHELWLEPQDYMVDPEATVMADIVNGESFAGPKIPYLPQRFAHFVMFSDGRAVEVPGRVGDMPALNMAPPGEGLAVVAYQANDATVDYETWEKFASFAEHKGFGDVLPRHLERGLPRDGFKEVYSRYSKTLVAVGSGAGADMRTGLETEIVALTNPYTDDLSGGMRFQLFYRDDVRANARFEVFAKAPDGTVTQTFYETDADGIATVPVEPGVSYMADAVVLREPNAQVEADTGGVWETLWANMTWAVPAAE